MNACENKACREVTFYFMPAFAFYACNFPGGYHGNYLPGGLDKAIAGATQLNIDHCHGRISSKSQLQDLLVNRLVCFDPLPILQSSQLDMSPMKAAGTFGQTPHLC